MRTFRSKQPRLCERRASTARRSGARLCPGASDANVAERLRSEARVLVTLDLDFANIQAYPPDRLRRYHCAASEDTGQSDCSGFLHKIIPILEDRRPDAELWIVQRDRIRFRRGN